MTPEQLLATKPKREQLHSEEEFEEATNYWMLRQGRSPMLQPGYKKPPEAEKRDRQGLTRRDLDEPAEGSPSSEK